MKWLNYPYMIYLFIWSNLDYSFNNDSSLFELFTHTNTTKSYNWIILWKSYHYNRWCIRRYVIPSLESCDSFLRLSMRSPIFRCYHTYLYIWVFAPSLGDTVSSVIVRMKSYPMAYLSILFTFLVWPGLELYICTRTYYNYTYIHMYGTYYEKTKLYFRKRIYELLRC